jgi:protein-tyrosine phosphatase
MRKTSILFVCLGNICRSAAAEAIMKAVADKAGIGNFLSIDSAGILNVHEGQPADLRMRQAAKAHGYDVCSISRPVTLADFDKFDLIIGMDNSNIDDLKDKALTQEHIDKIHAMAKSSHNL